MKIKELVCGLVLLSLCCQAAFASDQMKLTSSVERLGTAYHDTHDGQTPDEPITTNSFFANKYTFEIINAPSGLDEELAAIEDNAIAVIEYLSDYVEWQGTLDFAVWFLPYDYFDVNGLGLLPSLGGEGDSGYTWAAEEAFTGVDANGDYPDIGCFILPNENGSLTNYGRPLSFDPSPDFYKDYSPPAGTDDFASIFLHELGHSMALWSDTEEFKNLTISDGDHLDFIGANVAELLGQNLNMAHEGSIDHYGPTPAISDASPSVDRGLMYMYGNYEQNRWHLGKLDLAILKDFGWKTANSGFLDLVEQASSVPTEKPLKAGEQAPARFINLMESIRGLGR